MDRKSRDKALTVHYSDLVSLNTIQFFCKVVGRVIAIHNNLSRIEKELIFILTHIFIYS